MARLSRGQRFGAGAVALRVLAFLTLVLVLGLVAMPSLSPSVNDNRAVVELKLPLHK